MPYHSDFFKDVQLDSESICYDCAGKFMLKHIHEGVALCLWCRIKEAWYNLISEFKL